MAVLQLTPLCRRLREDVEGGRMFLDDSVSLLVDASFLVLAKVQWLLPRSAMADSEQAEEELADNSLEYEENRERCLEESRFLSAVESTRRLMQQSQLIFSRGVITQIEGAGHVETAAVEAAELFEIMESLKGRIKPRERTVVVLKRNFSDHMRWFWREVNKLVSQYTVLRFSLFMNSDRPDLILNFLVLLELVKRRRVFARQPEVFGDIIFSTKRDVVQM